MGVARSYSVWPPEELVSVTSCSTSTHMSRRELNRPMTQLRRSKEEMCT